ncbi:hypothetical protein EHQ53_13995 [Leptospira langatensis]|uniref:Uncharacterized protein n=1 Tax=Leptospira langatensis TaxID=2484983 RepID=A0ABY2M973_9LEPT|nr:hypothetical protein EHQ53_13995 [Leptospira langatensis]
MDRFFRLRSPLGIETDGEESLIWAKANHEFERIAQALRFIDFTPDHFDAEVISCLDVTYGGFSRGDLAKLPFDRYEKIISHVMDLQQKIKERSENG